jgi:hypothetical protein
LMLFCFPKKTKSTSLQFPSFGIFDFRVFVWIRCSRGAWWWGRRGDWRSGGEPELALYRNLVFATWPPEYLH